MEVLVYKNSLYKLTKFIRNLPNACDITNKFSYDIGTEDEMVLQKIFAELYKKHLTNLNIYNFLDVCAAPGAYSKYILNKHPQAFGVGISLDPKDGGPEFKVADNRYQQIYQDVFQISLNEYGNESIYDLCMASCLLYSVTANSLEKYKLIFKSLTICIHALKENGTLIINFSFKDIIFAVNFVYLIGLLFEKIKLFKSTNYWILQRTFYVIGYGYTIKPNIVKKINDYIEDFDNFYKTYRKKLLPSIDPKTLKYIIKLLESDVFMVQLQTYMLKSFSKPQ